VIFPIYTWEISTYVIGILTEKTFPELRHCIFDGTF